MTNYSELYSQAFERARRGESPEDTSRIRDPEARAAIELGQLRGGSLQSTVSNANRNDPSSEYLTRVTVDSMKWRF